MQCACPMLPSVVYPALKCFSNLEVCHPRCVVNNRDTNMCVCVCVCLNTTELLVEYLIIYINNYMFRP
jgi:hypothetical protein